MIKQWYWIDSLSCPLCAAASHHPSLRATDIFSHYTHFSLPLALPIRLRVQLHVVGREQARLPIEVSEPPVLVRELQIGDFGVLREAQF